MGRAPCCDKASVKKGPWSPAEDAKLKAYIEEHGTGGNWIALPQKIGLKRCGKSCRLRWLNYLRPNIKHGGFSAEEDQIILSLYISIGSRWSIIAAQLPGRTDNDIKNYWNTRLKKKLLGKRREQLPFLQSEETHSMMVSPETVLSSQTLTAGALERMQLHMHLHEGLYSTSPFLYSNINTINPALWPMNESLRGELLEGNVQQEISNVGFQITKHAVPANLASQNAQGHMECSALGFSSPSSHEMLVQEEERQWNELASFKEMFGDEKESLSWWSNDGFEESQAEFSSSNSKSLLNDCLMFQEYVVGYDL